MTTQLSTHRDLLTLAGTELGTSGWVEITQSQVDQFAEATGDHQWIHIDPQRAKTGPFGGTIAHGFLTLRWRRGSSTRSCTSTPTTPCSTMDSTRSASRPRYRSARRYAP